MIPFAEWRTSCYNGPFYNQMRSFYFNKDDPRIVIFHHPKHKWMGGTFNLAHPVTRRLFLYAAILPVFIILSLLLFKNLFGNVPSIITIITLVLYQFALTIYFVRIILRNMKDHPGP